MVITKKIGIPVLFLIALTLIFILLSTSENYPTIDLFNKVKGPIFTEIFPEGKRNSGGFKWFNYFCNLKPTKEEFDIYNSQYCGVSGAIVNPEAPPTFDYIKIKDPEGNDVYGKYYRCCWPCCCDLMREDNGTPNILAEDYEVELSDGNFTYKVLTMANLCNIPKDSIPAEATPIVCENGKVKDAKYSKSGRIIIAVLFEPTLEPPSDYKEIEGCPERNKTPVTKLKGGMGDIFVKLSVAGK